MKISDIKINTNKIEEIIGENKVEKIKFENGENLEIDGIFIAQGIAGSIDFAKKIGIIVKDNKIIVDENMKTNINGIYSCGDCAIGIMQISKAVYEGMVAGLQVIKYVKEKNNN